MSVSKDRVRKHRRLQNENEQDEENILSKRSRNNDEKDEQTISINGK